jgi:hypothetical protein
VDKHRSISGPREEYVPSNLQDAVPPATLILLGYFLQQNWGPKMTIDL